MASAQACHSQQLIHSSWHTLKLQVIGWRWRDQTSSWLAKTKPMSFQTCSSILVHATCNGVAGCSHFRECNTAIYPHSIPAQLLDYLASLTLHREHASTPHILHACLEAQPAHSQSCPGVISQSKLSRTGGLGWASSKLPPPARLFQSTGHIWRLDLWLNSHPQSNIIEHMLIVLIGSPPPLSLSASWGTQDIVGVNDNPTSTEPLKLPPYHAQLATVTFGSQPTR